MRKLKLLAALLAVMAVVVSSIASPAMARHWDYYDDPWGECGWMEVWDDSIFYPYYEFEGYEYDCHRNYPDFDRYHDHDDYWDRYHDDDWDERDGPRQPDWEDDDHERD